MSRPMRRMLLSKSADGAKWAGHIRNATRILTDALLCASNPGHYLMLSGGLAMRIDPTPLDAGGRLREAKATRTRKNTSEPFYLYQKEPSVTRKNGFAPG